MTDLRKAAEMALKDWLANDEGVVRFGMELKPEWVSTVSHGFLSGYEEALRQALAQPDEVLAEREACAKLCEGYDVFGPGTRERFADAIRARSEKPPVKSYCGGKPNYCTPEVTPDVNAVNMSRESVDETAKGEHEPVAWRYNGHIHEFDPSDWASSVVTPLYTAPPKREWVGLTVDEVFECWKTGDVVAAVEAKLKEKNGG